MDQTPAKAEESERESEPGSLHSDRESRASGNTLRSINFGTSIDSGQVQVSCPPPQTYQRRKSSTSGGSLMSQKSLHSSARSKRGTAVSFRGQFCSGPNVEGMFQFPWNNIINPSAFLR